MPVPNTPDASWQALVELATAITPITVSHRMSQLLSNRDRRYDDVIDDLYSGASMSDASTRSSMVSFITQSETPWPTDFGVSAILATVAAQDLSAAKHRWEDHRVYSAMSRYSAWLTGRLAFLGSLSSGTVSQQALQVYQSSTTIIGSAQGFITAHGWIDDPGHGAAV